MPYLVNSDSISLGISPSYLDLGEIEPGNSKIAHFYIVTSSDELFLVYLGSSKAIGRSIFEKEEYKNLLQFYSEEDSSSWINFINNPVKLLPPNETLEKTEAGFFIKGMREITFIVKIPPNAEPGYHIGQINMNPQVIESGSVTLMSIIPMNYILKVKGNATRNGEIIDITNNGIFGGRLWLKIFYKNTGNVTTFVDKSGIKILNNEGKEIGSVPTTMDYVRPGEVKELDGFMDYSYIEEGTYPAKATVSFITGIAEGGGIIKIEKPSEVPTGKIVEKEREERKFPLWIIVLLIILIIIVVLYIFLKG